MLVKNVIKPGQTVCFVAIIVSKKNETLQVFVKYGKLNTDTKRDS